MDGSSNDGSVGVGAPTSIAIIQPTPHSQKAAFADTMADSIAKSSEPKWKRTTFAPLWRATAL